MSMSVYADNRARFPLEELRKYADQWVAFSLDGSRVLVSAATLTELKIDIAAMSNVRLNLIFAAQRRSKRLGGTRNDAALASAAVATRSDGRCSWVSSRAPIGARLSKCVIADLP